jgi:hypothetical protein
MPGGPFFTIKIRNLSEFNKSFTYFPVPEELHARAKQAPIEQSGATVAEHLGTSSFYRFFSSFSLPTTTDRVNGPLRQQLHQALQGAQVVSGDADVPRQAS